MASSPHAVRFTLLTADGAARRGVLHTPHGDVQTPAFMPVGTLGAVKGVDPGRLAETGAQMVLGNTYHLALRPGAETVAALGGLHAMMGWGGPILTDSGGFQVFSLGPQVRVDERAATFRSHVDGSTLTLSPEAAVEAQQLLGSDVAMVLDHVVALPADAADVRLATERSVRWAERCQRAATRADQSLFAIVQGGLDPDLRRWCAERLVEMGFAGYAVGGLSVGEAPDEMVRALGATTPWLPADKPRYLMGVGRPQDLLDGVALGVDMFDCVMPTRNGRNALAFTDRGTLRLRNARHARSLEPVEEGCPCPACRHSRGYLRHLFQAGEMLGPILLSIHNLTYYQRLMAGARRAIEGGAFHAFREAKLRGWRGADPAA